MAHADGTDEHIQAGEENLDELARADNALTRRLVIISAAALLVVFIIAAILIALITNGGGAKEQNIDRVTPLTIQVSPAAQAASSLLVRLP